MSLRYYVLDVFTGTPLEGNPLAAVVSDAPLPAERMQQIAAEFNLSETIFFEPAANPASRARIRIFTRTLELPFAGHPTVGGAMLLAHLNEWAGAAQEFDVEEAVGTLRCRVQLDGSLGGHAAFDLPRLPVVEPARGSLTAIAAALSVSEEAIGCGDHAPLEMSAGTPFTAVPLRSLVALRSVRPRADLWTEAFGDGSHNAAFVYTAGGVAADAAYHCRVFAPNQGIREDPATGSAAAAFIGAMTHWEGSGDGAFDRVLEQGFEVGRPSRLLASYRLSDGSLTAGSVGGDVVIVARGELFC